MTRGYSPAWRRSLLAAGLVISGGAQAQSAGVADKQDQATDLDAVTVIGERREMNLEQEAEAGALGGKRLLDTPFSITVVDAEDIARRQATTLGQVFANDPAVHAAEPAATTPWWNTTIRGIGVTMHYVDGVPLLMQWGGEFPLEAVESVQALKGLGGFMYGFGAPGGIFSYQTKKPTDTPLLATTLGWRNDGVFSVHLDAGGRVAGKDSFGYRVNAAVEQGDAYNGAGIDRNVLSLAVDQPLGDALIWHAQVVREDNTLKHEPLYFYWDLYEDEHLPKPTYDYENVAVRNSYYKAETLQASTGLRWDIGENWRADFSFGQSRKDHRSNKMFADMLNEAGDYAGSVYNFAGLLRNRVGQAVAQGQVQTGAIRHELVLGASWQRVWEQWSNEFYYSNDFNGNLYQEQDYTITRPPDFSLAPVSFDERQTSLFASDTLHFGDYWQAIVGLRRTELEQKDLDGDPDVDSGYRTSATTPTFALVWKPAADAAVYASYVESLESGGRVPQDAEPPYANADELLEATISKQFEIGAKYQLGKLGFTVAAFRVERAAQIDVLRGEDLYLVQDGLTLYRGFEAIGNLAVSADLDIGVGALWLDPTLQDLSNWEQELEGNRAPYASRVQAVANFNWRVAPVAGLSLHGNLRHSGDAYYDAMNRILIPSYTVASAGFQYSATLGGNNLTLTGNINNLFNRKYWSMDMLGEARNAALDLRIDW
ncbi:MAG: TonB-dependent siderophore receptor [Pseudoxanthomonas sp.]